MYNFQTATQIVHALQLPSIERLKKTWSKVPSFEQRLYSQLKFFCSPLRDFRLLREATGALASQWGPPGQEDRDPDMTLSGIPGALPFFGKGTLMSVRPSLDLINRACRLNSPRPRNRQRVADLPRSFKPSGASRYRR